MTLQQYITNNEKEHLIFDLDETLAHLILPWHIYNQRIWDILKELDEKIHDKYYDPEFNPFHITNLLIENNEKVDIKPFTDWALEFEEKYLEDIKPNQELIDFVRMNQHKYDFYLWTSQTRPAALYALKSVRLTNQFRKIITRTDVTMMKPNAEGYALIDPENTLPKEKAVMIGDSNGDEGAAKNAGIDFYRVEYFK